MQKRKRCGKKKTPSLVLLEFRSAESSSFRELNEQKIPSLALLSYPSSLLAEQALSLGATSILYRGASLEELQKALQETLCGKRWKSFRESDIELPKPLSPREKEVLALLARGEKTREVAESLSISVKTVETHRAHIQEKLGVKALAELVKYAILVELSPLT